MKQGVRVFLSGWSGKVWKAGKDLPVDQTRHNNDALSVVLAVGFKSRISEHHFSLYLIPKVNYCNGRETIKPDDVDLQHTRPGATDND
jgi:hypothetical protein